MADEIDFYEDIVAPRHAEPDYNEVKQRMTAAEAQLEAAEERIRTLEAQLRVKEIENGALRKNISKLYRTAKVEIDRKTAENLRLVRLTKKK